MFIILILFISLFSFFGFHNTLVLKIGEFFSYSWGIYSNVAHLALSRSSENIFWMKIDICPVIDCSAVSLGRHMFDRSKKYLQSFCTKECTF